MAKTEDARELVYFKSGPREVSAREHRLVGKAIEAAARACAAQWRTPPEGWTIDYDSIIDDLLRPDPDPTEGDSVQPVTNT